MSIENILQPNNLDVQFGTLTLNDIDASIGNITTLNSTTGNITTLNSTTGNITTVASTTGNITTVNSTTGNITNVASTNGNITNINTNSIIYGNKLAVTQQTSISTAVDVNSKCFNITTVSSTLAAGASASFTVNNTQVLSTSFIFITLQYSGAGIANVYAPTVNNGSFTMAIINDHPTDALNSTLKIFCLVL